MNMIEEEIKLRCIEMVAKHRLQNDYPNIKHILQQADNLYKSVYIYLKKNEFP